MIFNLATGVTVGLGTVAALGLAAGGCAYAAMWPGSRLFGDALIAPKRPGELALTFDDGPNPIWTPRLLDTLAESNIQATFFLVGSYAESQKELVRRIVSEGHLVGNHSWSHPNLALTCNVRVREELQRTSQTLEQISGQSVRYFRPPFGARRPLVLCVAREFGMQTVLWNAMTSDWNNPSAESITARLASKIDRLKLQGKAANIVLHDGNHLDLAANREPSIHAVRLLIARYRNTHRFVTLDAWNQ